MTRWLFPSCVALIFVILLAADFGNIYGYIAYVAPMKTAVFEPGAAHYDRIPVNGSHMSMKAVALQDDGAVRVEFGQNDYKLYSRHLQPRVYEPIPRFSHSDIFQINDTFAVICIKRQDSDPTSIGMVKYLGPSRVDGETLLFFWHESATLSSDMHCDYPQIIIHSLNLWDLEAGGYR